MGCVQSQDYLGRPVNFKHSAKLPDKTVIYADRRLHASSAATKPTTTNHEDDSAETGSGKQPASTSRFGACEIGTIHNAQHVESPSSPSSSPTEYQQPQQKQLLQQTSVEAATTLTTTTTTTTMAEDVDGNSNAMVGMRASWRRADTEVLKKATMFDRAHEEALKPPTLIHVHEVRMGRESQRLLQALEEKERQAQTDTPTTTTTTTTTTTDDATEATGTHMGTEALSEVEVAEKTGGGAFTDVRNSKLYSVVRGFEEKEERTRAEPRLEKTFEQRRRERALPPTSERSLLTHG